MLNARRQAEGYARALPVSHGWPPFILVCDVGHVIETYADFSGQGKNYAQFPDRQSFRIYLEDLRRPEIRERLRASGPTRYTWTRRAKLLGSRGKSPSGWPRCRRRWKTRETRRRRWRCSSCAACSPCSPRMSNCCRSQLPRPTATLRAGPSAVCTPGRAVVGGDGTGAISPSRWRPRCGASTASSSTRAPRAVGPGGDRRIAPRRLVQLEGGRSFDLRHAAGTGAGQVERRRLGAHYTPRAYVERLVVATVIEPLRSDWEQALSTAERQKAAGRSREA